MLRPPPGRNGRPPEPKPPSNYLGCLLILLFLGVFWFLAGPYAFFVIKDLVVAIWNQAIWPVLEAVKNFFVDQTDQVRNQTK